MTRAQALRILDEIPWNKLRYRTRSGGGRMDVTLALSEQQMQAVSLSISSLRNSAATLGSVGGITRAFFLTKERRQEIARNAGLARWSKKCKCIPNISGSGSRAFHNVNNCPVHRGDKR